MVLVENLLEVQWKFPQDLIEAICSCAMCTTQCQSICMLCKFSIFPLFRNGKKGKIVNHKWMKMSTHLSPSWPKINVPIISPMRCSANVFVLYISLEHTQSSWDTIVLSYHCLSKSWISQSIRNENAKENMCKCGEAAAAAPTTTTTAKSTKRSEKGKKKLIFAEKCQVTNKQNESACRTCQYVVRMARGAAPHEIGYFYATKWNIAWNKL